MEKCSTVVIGGGASGMTAAVSCRRKGDTVVICEKKLELGKKILASGNGRCNLLNESLNEDYYNEKARPLIKSVFEKFGKDEIKRFFLEIGLRMYSDNGRVFPVTNQSSSVLRVLKGELKRLAVSVELGFDVVNVSASKNGFIVEAKSGKQINCRRIVLAGGGKTYPSFGSDGSAYALACRLGHSMIEPVPSAVPLVVKDGFCRMLQGQRIFSLVKCLINGRISGEAQGDLLFTKYGLSGRAVLDISREISVAINRHCRKDVAISVNMVPFLDRTDLIKEFAKRIRAGTSAEDMLVGILPNKLSFAFKGVSQNRDPETITDALNDKRFIVAGTRGWNEAEFTAGGVNISEVKEGTLESRIIKGLYFAGEILDVDGTRGGYNLAWAWASGYIAGSSK